MSESPTRRRVQGHVTDRSSGRSLAGLIVTIHDADGCEPLAGRRLGSVMTDAAGAFALDYPWGEHERGGPDLVVTVDDPDDDGCDRRVFACAQPRKNAGPIETYAIRLRGAARGAEAMEPVAHRGRLPGSTSAPAIPARTIHDAMRVLAPSETSVRTLVAPGDSVRAATSANVRAGLQRILGAGAIRGRTSLSRDMARTLGVIDAEGRPRLPDGVPAAAMETVLRSAEATSLERLDPTVLACRPRQLPADPCAPAPTHDHDGGPVAPDPDTAASLPPVALVPAPIPAPGNDGRDAFVRDLIGRLFDDRLPAVPVSDGGRLPELRGGPAERTMFHDFDLLQVAFDHVWVELYDRGVVDQVRALFEKIEHEGGRVAMAPTRDQLLDGLRAEAARLDAMVLAGIPADVAARFAPTADQWRTATTAERSRLGELAAALANRRGHWANLDDRWVFVADDSGEAIEREARNLLAAAGARSAIDRSPGALVQQLEAATRTAYPFTVYAAGAGERSLNFGVLTTYRQRWEPLGYQVGKLVRTVPLAPRESRKYAKKTSHKRSRSAKEVENNLRVTKDDVSDTSRGEAEILRRAESKSNFSAAAEGGINLKVFSAGVKTSFGTESATASNDAKKDFREAVVKASDEYKLERSVEVTVTDSVESDAEESGEISNPNEEIPVTYLFYELERRYRLSERIHRARPVILVAQEVPRPETIDAAWLTAHDWILRRVLLDDSFVPALDRLANQDVEDERAIAQLERNVEQQRALVDVVGADLRSFGARSEARYAELQRAVERRAFEANREGTGPGDADEMARILEEGARDAYERAARDQADLESRLEGTVSALAAATDAYNKALAAHERHHAQIARLCLHVKQNILYYLQAIWSHEPPDQRFLRLHRVEVPRLRGQRAFQPLELGGAGALAPGFAAFVLGFAATITFEPPDETDPLEEVADLGDLLGFHGNYMVFPLRASNPVTDHLLTPYVDAVVGLRDPDAVANWTLDDFERYVCCLQHTLTPEELAALRPQLERDYQALLTAPRRLSEEITVPTGSLYIDTLVGTSPVLEPFKLAHRAIDVARARVDLRTAALEGVRAAARMLSGERGDPQIDKRIVVSGAAGGVVVDD